MRSPAGPTVLSTQTSPEESIAIPVAVKQLAAFQRRGAEAAQVFALRAELLDAVVAWVCDVDVAGGV